MAYLSGRRMNLLLLRELGKKCFKSCFEREISGSVCIGWCNNSLMADLNSILEVDDLIHDLDVRKMINVEKGTVIQNFAANFVFITKPDYKSFKLIENVMKARASSKELDRVKFYIMCIPRTCFLCEQGLSVGVKENHIQKIIECPIDFFPFENDLFSMELPEAFREYALEDDNSCLFVAARGLNMLQNMYGTIPKVYGKGKAAELVAQYMMNMRRENSSTTSYSSSASGANSAAEVTPIIDNLLLIDRSVDLLSLLPTQMTYEGLLDEIAGIKCATVKLPGSIFKKDDIEKQELQDLQKLTKVPLNSSDSIFAENRDGDFRLVIPYVRKKLNSLKEHQNDNSEKTVAELKIFTSVTLPKILEEKRQLSKHISIASFIQQHTHSRMEFEDRIKLEQSMFMSDSGFINSGTSSVDLEKVIPYIETCIAKQEPITKVLRLMCLQSVLNNGLKQKVLDHYKREVIQTYGYQYLTTLINLEKAGLLSSPTSKVMSSVKKTLKLTDIDFNYQNPSDIFSVFDGYAPLSVRLAQYLISPGWRSIEEILKVLPGPKIEIQQELPLALRKKAEDPAVAASAFMSPAVNPQVTLVFFIGGVTFAEVSALRLLSAANEENGSEFMIGTTSMINGNTFIESLMDDYSTAFDTSDLTSYDSNPSFITRPRGPSNPVLSTGSASTTQSSNKRR